MKNKKTKTVWHHNDSTQSSDFTCTNTSARQLTRASITALFLPLCPSLTPSLIQVGLISGEHTPTCMHRHIYWHTVKTKRCHSPPSFLRGLKIQSRHKWMSAARTLAFLSTLVATFATLFTGNTLLASTGYEEPAEQQDANNPPSAVITSTLS